MRARQPFDLDRYFPAAARLLASINRSIEAAIFRSCYSRAEAGLSPRAARRSEVERSQRGPRVQTESYLEREVIHRTLYAMRTLATLLLGAALIAPLHSAEARKGGGFRSQSPGPKFSPPAVRSRGQQCMGTSCARAPLTKNSMSGSNRVTRDHRGEAPKRQAPTLRVRPCRQAGQVGGYCDRYNRPVPVRNHRDR